MTFNYQQVPGGGQDDVLNASGLGAPAIIRGSVFAHLASGLVMGAGQTTGVRQTNATALQNAITYAASHGKFFVIEPGVYEINSSTGLSIPAQGVGNYGLTLIGSRYGSQIIQFYATTPSCPILTIGDTTGATASSGVKIEGLNLSYGAAQTGFTSAKALNIGYLVNSIVGDIHMPMATNPAYNAVDVAATNISGNRFHDISAIGFQNIGLNFNPQEAAAIPPSQFQNLVIQGGSSGNPAIANFINFPGTVGELFFDGLTLANGACNVAILFGGAGARAVTINALHMEQIKLTGSQASFFSGAASAFTINGFKIVDPIILSAALTGTPYLYGDYQGGSSTVIINNLNITCLAATGEITSNFGLLGLIGAASPDYVPNFEVNKFISFDNPGGNIQGHIFLDDHMPMASNATPEMFNRFVHGAANSVCERAKLNVSATYTHWSQHEHATIVVPSSITSFTLTLGARISVTASTQLPRTGSTVHIRRSGNAGLAGTLTIVNGGAGAGTLNTNTTAVDLWYQFDGTNWVALTPVP
jgi:hypothetical protein